MWSAEKHFSPFRIVVLFMVLALAGLAITGRLFVDLTPDYSNPQLNISFTFPGASPEFAEQEATAPLENALSTLANIKNIYSVSRYDGGYVQIEFQKDADLDYRRFEAAAIIRQLYKQLHPGISYPVIARQTPDDEQTRPLLVYRAMTTVSPEEAGLQVRRVFRGLGMQAGVSEVRIAGDETTQVTIRYDQSALRRNGISTDLLEQAISQVDAWNVSGKSNFRSGQVYNVKVWQQHTSVEGLRSLIIAADSGRIVRLGDVAEIKEETTTPGSYYRINGLNAISLSIFADGAFNRIVLAEQLKTRVTQLAKDLPPGYEILLGHEDTEFLVKELDKIYLRAALSVAILCLLILVVRRDLRYLGALFSGILINLLLTLLGAWLLDIKIHLYTIAGLTISFGLIVDNAIVMIDHIHSRKSTGIVTALVAASLTTVAALSVVYFLPDEERQNLTEFSGIISLGLAISLIISLFYSPAVYALLMRNIKPPDKVMKKRAAIRWWQIYYQFVHLLASYKKSFLTFIILVFGLPVFLLPSQWPGQSWYNQTVGHDVYQEKIRTFSDKMLGGTLRLFVRDVYERYSYRTPEETLLFINAGLPYGHTPQQMDHLIVQMEGHLKNVQGIKTFITSVYSGQQASITVSFDEDHENGPLPYMLKSRLISHSLDMGGAEWDIYGVGRGFSNSGNDEMPSFRVTMRGYNYNELERQANQFATKLEKHQRIQKVNIDERLSWNEQSTKELVLNIDQEKLSYSGGQAGQVTNQLVALTEPSLPVTHISSDDRFLPVFLQEKNAYQFNKYDLMNAPLALGNERNLRLGPFATLSVRTTKNAIHKENRRYIRIVGFDYMGSFSFAEAYLDKTMGEMGALLPAGYEMEKQTWSWDWNKAKRQYGLLIVLLVAVYFICAILFENLKQPFYIILCVPVSFIGLFLVFSVFGFYFDQGGYAAFIMLGGLAVNAGIFVVNDLNAYKKGPYNRNVIKAVAGKAWPIILTVLSTCFGLIPFVFGGQQEVFWFSLAIGTIGGLMFSMVAVFVVLPVILFRTSG